MGGRAWRKITAHPCQKFIIISALTLSLSHSYRFATTRKAVWQPTTTMDSHNKMILKG